MLYVHGKKAKELKQGVRLEDGGHTGSLPTPHPAPKNFTARRPPPPFPTAMLCSFRESEMYITMTVEHAQFKKANTAVHLPFFTPHFNHLDLLAAEGLEAMHLTQAHHWFHWLVRKGGQISQMGDSFDLHLFCGL